MPSFAELEFACVGAAALVDAVLLVTLLGRRNWRHTLLPILLLVAGTALWHGAAFLRLLLLETRGRLAGGIEWLIVLTMAAGLMLIPSAMLHGLWRLYRSGLAAGVRPYPWYALAYVPLLLLVPVAWSLQGTLTIGFLDVLRPWVKPYACWVGAVNVIAAAGMARLASRSPDARGSQFLKWVAGALAALALFQSFALLYAVHAWPAWRPWFTLGVVLSPLVPALLFAYFVVRFNFQGLVFKRAVVYGAVLLGLVLIHRIVFADLRQSLSERYRLDVDILETVLLATVVLLYPPLRRRVAEALRYLMGSRVDLLRRGCRQVSLGLSTRAGDAPAEIVAWFVAALREALALDYAGCWTCDSAGQPLGHCGDGPSLAPAEVALVYRDLLSAGLSVCTRDTAPTPATADLLDVSAASLAAVVRGRDVCGLLFLGRCGRNRDVGDEQAGAIMLLCEQLAATLDNTSLQRERLAAERHALQNEKLSALGLLASSIAHEIKNPLSSIKAIVAVMAEELERDQRHAEEFRLVLAEIDRLAASTTQLLQFARPSAGSGDSCRLEPVLDGTLRVMRHLAAQRGVGLRVEIPAELPPLRADENSLREVCFNLVANSIEAAGASGQVMIRCFRENGQVVAEFQDDGPGIAADVQDRLFEPFVTTKPAGTGLGLYTVRRRVQEFGGEICCRSAPGRGTCFTVKWPCGLAADEPQPHGTSP